MFCLTCLHACFPSRRSLPAGTTVGTARATAPLTCSLGSWCSRQRPSRGSAPSQVGGGRAGSCVLDRWKARVTSGMCCQCACIQTALKSSYPLWPAYQYAADELAELERQRLEALEAQRRRRMQVTPHFPPSCLSAYLPFCHSACQPASQPACLRLFLPALGAHCSHRKAQKSHRS